MHPQIPGEGRVSKRSVGCGPEGAIAPANHVHQTPVNFISASYYVERPSKPEALDGGESTMRHTSFCRIEQGCQADDSGRTDGWSDDGWWVVRDLDAL
jgi:hypothetical protein